MSQPPLHTTPSHERPHTQPPRPPAPRQYHIVLQTLTLWSEISTDMFRLWVLAEDDMLRETNGYRWGERGCTRA